MIHPRFYTLAGIVLAAAALRLVPHPPNFTPVAAIALFAGAHFAKRTLAFGVPLAAMVLSDLLIGFHSGVLFVYAAFAGIVGLGLLVRARITVLRVGGAALAGSVLFFAVSNLGAWAVGGLYPLTGVGLLEAYTAAIPFFANTLAGDLFFAGLLFGGFALAQRSFPILREEALPAV